MNLSVFLVHTMAISGLSRARTELFHLFVIPFLPPHPVETDGQPTCHSYLGDLLSPSHHQVEIPATPFRDTARRDLGCFHQ